MDLRPAQVQGLRDRRNAVRGNDPERRLDLVQDGKQGADTAGMGLGNAGYLAGPAGIRYGWVIHGMNRVVRCRARQIETTDG